MSQMSIVQDLPRASVLLSPKSNNTSDNVGGEHDSPKTAMKSNGIFSTVVC